jgi:hypothetical protein
MSPPESESQDWDEETGEGPADLIADEAEESALAEQAARALIAARDRGEDISPEIIQQLLTPLIKIYTVRFQSGDRSLPLYDPRNVPPTAVMVTCASMLRALNIEVFELAIWQAFTSGMGSKQE